MKVVALISGGKDSCFNMMHCVANGHEISSLANLHPAPTSNDEMDSWMYQTVGHDIIDLYSEAMDLPLYREIIRGTNLETELHYSEAVGDETEDLYRLLARVLKDRPDTEAISVGAIASNYQRLRVENIASRLGLTVLSYLWYQDQTRLLREMISTGVHAILIKVACVGLNEKHLGLTLREIEGRMASLHAKFEVHPCGEGGEYESIVLDCPLFIKRLEITGREVVRLESDTAYLKLKARTQSKQNEEFSWRKTLMSSAALEVANQALLTDINSQSLENFSNLKLDTSHESTPILREQDNSTVTHGGIVARKYVVTASTTRPLQELLSRNTENILFCSVVLRNMSDFATINSEYGKLWTKAHPPSRVCIATSLPEDVSYLLYTVEMKKMESTAHPHEIQERRLWVQSRSYWAPSNIGPYSQVTISQGISFISGQIGLVPHNMQMASTFEEEMIWSLQSLSRIIQTQPIGNWRAATVCYVLQASDSAIKQITKAYQEIIAQPLETLLIVELLPGSQMPRQARIEWQFSAADPHGDYDVRVSVLPEPRGCNMEFSTTSNQGFWVLPANRLIHGGTAHQSASIVIEKRASVA